MKSWTMLGAVAGLAILAGSASADGKTVTLARNAKKGDAIRISIQINANAGGTDAVLNHIVKTTVKEVKDNGDIVTVTEDQGGKFSVGGQEQDMQAMPPATETRNKYGKLMELKADEPAMSFFSPETTKILAMLEQAILPDKAIAEGGTWTTEVDNPAVKGKKVTFKGTYVGTDKVDGVDLWKVKQTLEAATDDAGAKMTADITYWLSPADGSFVKAEGTVKGVPTTVGVGAVDWEQKLKVLKDEKKSS